MTNAELDSAILSTAARPRMEKFLRLWELADVVREGVTQTAFQVNNRVHWLGCDTPHLPHSGRWGWRPR